MITTYMAWLVAITSMLGNLPTAGGCAEPITPTRCELLSVQEISYTQKDEAELARIVYWEARGESEMGQLAVANVVLNRVRHENWPDTITGVIYQKHQFTPTKNSQYKTVHVPDHYYEIARRALEGERAVDDDVVYFSRGRGRYGHGWHKIGQHWFGRTD